MTPSVHKEQPVKNFLCEDSGVCVHDKEAAQVQQYYSGGGGGLPPAFVVFPPKCSSSLVLCVVSCPLLLVITTYFPVSQPPHLLFWTCYSAQHKTVQLLDLSSQCKTTVAQLGLAFRDNYLFFFCVRLHVDSIIACSETLMTLLCLWRLGRGPSSPLCCSL